MIGRAIVVASLAAASVARADATGTEPARPIAAAKPAEAAKPTEAVKTAAPASEPPDAAADEAGDANLESTANRRGMTFAAALGAGVTAGFGIEDSVGRGGALAFRIGHVATPHTVITLEFDVSGALHRPTKDTTAVNTNGALLAGAQYYVSPSLSLRLGIGGGAYTAHGILVAGSTMLKDRTTIGPAVLGGIGVDLARVKWAVFGIEATTTAMINGGVLLGSSLKLGVAFD
ncbi:MAG TPA: hypothetical protein VIX73_10330 [Kofleriaceae bacterium]|jgi:hypothetical protein